MPAEERVKLECYNSIYYNKLKKFHLPPEQLPFTAHPSDMVEADEKKHPIVITYNSEPVGFFVLHCSERVQEYCDNKYAMLLTAFSINHNEQGKGFAFQALKDLQDFILAMFPFCNEIVLAVNKRNIPAQKLYKKAGFTDTGRRKLGKIGEQYIMSLKLPASLLTQEDKESVDLKYPIGSFDLTKDVQKEQIAQWINEIETLPAKLADTIKGWNNEQLDTTYRHGGWTVRQVVHHLADSHLNSIQRFKLALTENSPVITPYKEDQWAMLADYKAPVSVSLNLLSSLHERWVIVLRSLGETELERVFVHPENGKIKLSTAIGLYAWHGNHHLAHITNLALRKCWLGERHANKN